MEIDRRFFARVSGRRCDRHIPDHGGWTPFHVRPSRFRRPGDEEPFTMATSVDGRADGQNLADHRKNGHAARRNPGRYREARSGNDRSSAPGYRAHPHAGTERAFAANGTTARALDASRTLARAGYGHAGSVAAIMPNAFATQARSFSCVLPAARAQLTQQ